MNNFLFNCVTSMNPVGDHVWGMVLLAMGIGLVCAGHKDTGELIVGAGLAVFKTPVKQPISIPAPSPFVLFQMDVTLSYRQDLQLPQFEVTQHLQFPLKSGRGKRNTELHIISRHRV